MFYRKIFLLQKLKCTKTYQSYELVEIKKRCTKQNKFRLFSGKEGK